MWTTVGEVCSKIGSGSTPKGSNYSNTGIPFFRSQNVYNTGIVLSDIKYISDEVHQSMIGTEVVANDLLLNITGGSLGRCAIVPDNFSKGNVSQHVCILRSIQVRPKYLHAFILSSFFVKSMKITGSGREGLPKYNLEKMFLPLPPLNEQDKIIDEVDNYFEFINMLESGEDNLIKLITNTKNKILDLAIHGKLVPQDPNDEPASELLKRINPKAEITCDNPQYGKLPEGWCLIQGKYLYKPMKSTKPQGLFFNYIDIDSIDNAKQNIDSVKVVKTENAPSRASRYTQKGDIVFSMVRPYLKNIAIVPDNDCIASTGFYVCSPLNVEISKYCYYVMISDYTVSGLNQFMKGDNSPSINKSDIDNWLFPLPPLSEQHRIVTKIEELFAQLDKIEASL